MTRLSLVAALVAAVSASNASAAGLTAVKPIPSYKCDILNITDAQAHDFNFSVPIMTEPSATSPVLGLASSIVIVHDPVIRVNDYERVLFFNGKPGWIEAGALRPYAIPGHPEARCVPSMMSDGGVGFGMH